MTSKDSPKIAASQNTDAAVVTSQVQHLHQLRHQRSFEQRYASIINQQILEKTINREVLQRQANAFFPFGRTSSNDSTENKEVKEVDEEDDAEVYPQEDIEQ